MSKKLTLLALLIGAPLLSNATPFWTPATVTQTVFQYPIASSSSALVSSSSASVSVSSNPLPPNIGTGIASITPQLEYPLRDLRQLDSLFTSVTDAVRTLLGTVDDLAKKLVGGVLSQTVSELRNAVNNLVSELNQVTDQVDSLNGFLSDIRSGPASTTSAGQVYDASQGILRRLAQLTTEVNAITSAIQKCPTKPDNLATLQGTLDNLEKTLWIFVSRIARKCGTPEEGHDLILTFQTRVTFLKSYSKWFSVTTPSLKEKAVGMTWNCDSRNKTFRRGTDGEREDAFVPGPCAGDSVPPEMGALVWAGCVGDFSDTGAVLDEADRILDMGFSRTLSAPLSHLPKSRQTLLFSATQTDSVNDLALLSLKDPVHIGTGDTGSSTSSAIPPNLEHHYLSCTLDQKLSILWGFIKTHLQSKTLVFLSSCKQVRFVFETFCKMHPGVPLLQIHGKLNLKQTARLAMYTKFTQAAHAVLFATDVAARGLDFPRVDWVLQVDAPEDAETCKALMFLLPSEEEGMKAALARKGVEVQRIKAKMSKDPEIKYLGQRAFVSYLCSIRLHKNKVVFNLAELPAERFAESLGLPGAPKIKFLSKEVAKQKKNKSRAVEAAQAEVREETADAQADSGEEDSGDEGDVHDSSDGEGGGEPNEEEDEDEDEPAKKPGAVRTKYDRMFERKNQNVLSAHYSKLIEGDGDDDDEEEFIALKRADHELDGGEVGVDEAADMSKRKQRLMASKAKRALLTGGLGKLIFDEEGKPHKMYEMEDADAWINDKGGIRKAGVIGGGLMVADADDDSYVEPEFDLLTSDSDDEVWAPPPPTKRSNP
ncbi:hypothetical protein DFH08DRAFT_968253 [Mycena albidolilacea]|uniref:ATP-dependent RNA helicase n=1 Tax=Mycena albidolilacea TaxID=1033008 RepID=A0AAD6ZL05_9AGAR|nr:hypothetical protein DFH08DRAFT_968253 [Mycena albidolilacea]